MNVKKFLKKKAQEDLQSVRTDKDRETLQLLEDHVVEKAPEKKRNMKWLWAIPSGAVACAVTAILIVELLPSPVQDPGVVKYDEANFKQENSNISELSEALTYLTLNFTENQVVDVAKTSDSLSGDEVYYMLTVDENSAEVIYSMRLLIVVNDNYDYDSFTMELNFETKEYPDYSIAYMQQILADPDTGLNTIEGKAKINNAKYEMYVLKYQEYSFDNGNFLTIINHLLNFNH